MFSVLVRRDNNVLDINPPNADKNLTTNGSNWLFAVTAVFGVTLLSWLIWTMLLHKQRSATTSNAGRSDDNPRVVKSTHDAATVDHTPRGERVFHYLFTIAAFTGLIAYFTMASNLGNEPVRQYSNVRSNRFETQTRQVFYARYIYWFVAWSLVVVANLLVSGVSWATILFAVALLQIWIVSWLSGSFVGSSYRWGYFAFGCFAYLILSYVLLAWGRGRSRGWGSTKSYTPLAGLLVLVWLLYPIAWALGSGSNRLSITGEMIFYGILDIISIPIYGTMFLFLSKRFDHGSQYSFTQHGRRSGAERFLNSHESSTGYSNQPTTVYTNQPTTGYNSQPVVSQGVV